MILVSTAIKPGDWVEALQAALPAGMPVVSDLDTIDPAHIRYLVAWRSPASLFERLPNLRAVFNLGAGVDALLANDIVPSHIPLVRVVDGGMAEQMVEYCLYGILRFHRRFDVYEAQQAAQIWDNGRAIAAAECRVTVLGMGALGLAVAQAAQGLGYAVRGWSRSGGTIGGIACESGRAGLLRLLAATDIAVLMLPLTPDTTGMIDAEALAALPAGAALVNAARGKLVDEPALLAALDSGHLRGLLTDVTATEPLPAGHPLWTHPRVRLTPHIAAATLIGPTVAQIVANIDRMEQGEAPLGLVNRQRGY